MKVYIELLVILILMVIFILWKLWNSISRWILLKRYKPENERTKKGGVISYEGAVAGAQPTIDPASIDPIRPYKFEGREFLPKTTFDDARKDRTSTRKNRPAVGIPRRRLFGTRRR